MTKKPSLDKVSIILVHTKTAANIGAVARCMMNMGIGRLVLVSPPKDSNQDAKRLAAGAQRILETATVFPSLKEAVADQALVIGTSRHAGRLRKNVRAPREMTEHLLTLLDRNTVSIVFGNEVNGLERKDLALCHEIVSIPSSRMFPSINLSHAVMIIAYELFLASRQCPARLEIELAPEKDLENFYSRLQTTLEEIRFLDRTRPERIMFSLRQIFGRARLEARDVKIMQGILSAVGSITKKISF